MASDGSTIPALLASLQGSYLVALLEANTLKMEVLKL